MIWPFSKVVVFDFIIKPNSRAFQNAKAGCNQISGCGIAAQNVKVITSSSQMRARELSKNNVNAIVFVYI